MTTNEFLDRLFALTLDSPKAEMLALCYAEAGLGLGTRPWWPPLSEVWLDGETPPPHWAKGERVAVWAEAWALLQVLHSEYAAARR